jgi:hypothetical protein
MASILFIFYAVNFEIDAHTLRKCIKMKQKERYYLAFFNFYNRNVIWQLRVWDRENEKEKYRENKNENDVNSKI